MQPYDSGLMGPISKAHVWNDQDVDKLCNSTVGA